MSRIKSHVKSRVRPLLRPGLWRKALILALIALVGLPAQPFGRAQAQDDSPVRKIVISLSNDLLRHLPSKVRAILEGWQIKRLEEAVTRAHAELAQGDVCQAAKSLEAFLQLVRTFNEEKRSEILEDLYNQASGLRHDILSTQPKGRSCEGSERFDQPPQLKADESDIEHFSARVSFGEPRLKSIEGDGKLFTQVEVPGIDTNIGEPGLPAVPVFHQLIALPQGAKAEVRAKVDGGQSFKVNLYPFQPQPLDQVSDGKNSRPEFQDPPFTINKEAYESDALYPHEVCTITPLGKARDLTIAQISCAAGQYNPKTGALTLFDSIDFDVRFEGGNGAFLDESSAGQFANQNVFAEAVINKSVLARYRLSEKIKWFHFGEEFMILSPPALRPAADKLAAWKNAKGISTKVFQVADGAGPGPDTKEQIDALIENEYHTSLIRPSYVLLLGDADCIPPFYKSTSGSATTGTDYPYALLSSDGPDDLVPDFAVGRIPVDTLDQANTVVDKVINYEKTPPFSASFYSHASLASQFQSNGSGRDERSFIETSELARNTLLGHGYNAQRIYTRTGAGTPQRYYNNALLPADLGLGSGFAWDGDTNDIVNAFNAGRFLIVHRDHGWQYGWSNPSFESTNVINDLHNGSLLPVVFSINCASGLFDNETAGGDYGTTISEVYFAEHLLRKQNGGAVGMLGDTRNSPTWANSALMRGFFDAVWSDTLPAYGAAVSHRRLGDILNYGKCYLMTQVGVAGTTVAPTADDLQSEMYLWHTLGDPTLEMWTSRPWVFPHFELEVELNWKWWEWERVRFPIEGAVLTALQETEKGVIPIGRATVQNGEAAFEFVARPNLRYPIQISVSAENAVSETLAGKQKTGIF